MSVRDWDGMNWFLVAIGTLIVLSIGLCVAGEAIDGLDKRSCRNRGGSVEESFFDSEWRCVGRRAEAP